MASLIQSASKPSENKFITIVSGLPRSGTSMMMQMLEAGGMTILTDHVRRADKDNPRGYYELEKVKKIAENTSWLNDAHGKAFKMVSALLFHLPQEHLYRVVFMRRNMEEMLKSQRVMLQRLGKKGAELSDDELILKFTEHLRKVERWMASRRNMKSLSIDYSQIIHDPRANAGLVKEFLGGGLDEERMAGVVDPSLRNQKQST